MHLLNLLHQLGVRSEGSARYGTDQGPAISPKVGSDPEDSSSKAGEWGFERSLDEKGRSPQSTHSPVARTVFLGLVSFVLVVAALSKSQEVEGDHVQLLLGLSWGTGFAAGLIMLMKLKDPPDSEAATTSTKAPWVLLIATLVGINLLEASSVTGYSTALAFCGGWMLTAMFDSIRRDRAQARRARDNPVIDGSGDHRISTPD